MPTLTRWTVVRRWRGARSTLTLHAAGCKSVRRAEIVSFIPAPTRLKASVLVSQQHMTEVTAGVARWGAECPSCAHVG